VQVKVIREESFAAAFHLDGSKGFGLLGGFKQRITGAPSL